MKLSYNKSRQVGIRCTLILMEERIKTNIYCMTATNLISILCSYRRYV